MTEVELDSEGYLTDPSVWTPAWASEVAKAQNLELTEEHWDVLRFIRRSMTSTESRPTPVLSFAISAKHGAPAATGCSNYFLTATSHRRAKWRECCVRGHGAPAERIKKFELSAGNIAPRRSSILRPRLAQTRKAFDFGSRPENPPEYHPLAANDFRHGMRFRSPFWSVWLRQASFSRDGSSWATPHHRSRPRSRSVGHGHHDAGAHQYLAQSRRGAPRDEWAVRHQPQPDLSRKHYAHARYRTGREYVVVSSPGLLCRRIGREAGDKARGNPSRPLVRT